MAKKSFDNEHYDSIYAHWYEYFDKLEMSRFYVVNESKTEIIICGIFKITKNKNKKLSLKRFSFESQKWTSNFNGETYILHFKLFQTSINYVYSLIMRVALNELLEQVKIIDQYGSSKISSWQVEKIFINTKLKSTENKQNIVKAFIKELHENFIDKEIYSYTQKIFQTIPSIKQYLYIQHLDLKSLQRIEIENKNLLPIIAYLSPKSIIDNNIFSKKYWTDGVTLDGYYRHINKLDRFLTEDSSDRISFTGSQWRFIKSLRVSCINNIFNYRWLSKNKLEILSKINDIRNQPTNTINAFITLVSNIQLNNDDANEIKRYVIFFNALLKEFLARKKVLQKNAFQALIKFFINGDGDNGNEIYVSATTLYDQINDMIDFLFRASPHLHKNSTFNSILNLTREWEKSLYLAEINNKREIKKWKGSLIDFKYDNFTVEEINDELELAKEGYEMHHCVSLYADEAYRYKYKIFSIKDNTSNARATLGVKKTRICWEIDQVRGYCNATISSEDILSVCKDIIVKINNQYIDNYSLIK